MSDTSSCIFLSLDRFCKEHDYRDVQREPGSLDDFIDRSDEVCTA